jgi:hypothetical protein
VVTGFTINIASNPNDRRGSISVDTLKKGEYTMGYYDYLVSTGTVLSDAHSMLQVAPNPSRDTFDITRTGALKKKATAVIYDNGGRKVFECVFDSGMERIRWDATAFPTGMYHLVLQQDGIKGTQSVKLIKSTD